MNFQSNFPLYWSSTELEKGTKVLQNRSIEERTEEIKDEEQAKNTVR